VVKQKSGTKLFRYAVVGCGCIGEKRIKMLHPGQLAIACDVDPQKARSFIKRNGSGHITTNYKVAVADPAVDIVIVSTINCFLSKVTAAAIKSGKHVLVEKPAGIDSQEIKNLIRLAKKHKVYVRPGFNHRFHPAISKAHEIVSSGVLGPLMFICGRYGHGGRVGYHKEWRANPKLSGGGELIDQGVHLIDLARWFLGDFKTVHGTTMTYFWKMPVEDNAFLQLQTKKGQIAWLHASCTEWKNMFSLEIYGREGKLQIDGLGGSYGLERLRYYKMLPQMGPPVTSEWKFSGNDDSWSKEIKVFEEDIRSRREPTPNLSDALEVMHCVETIYKRNGYR